MRFYRGLANEPPVRMLRRHEEEASQLSLAIGEDVADGLAFRIAVGTGEAGRVERVVFLALRGDEGDAECFWPIPLDMPVPTENAAVGTVARDTARRVRALRAGRSAGALPGS